MPTSFLTSTALSSNGISATKKGLTFALSKMSNSSAIAAPSSLRRYASSSAKEVHFGAEGRRQLLNGCNRLTDAVSVTLGPKGRNVLIQQSYGPPKITKDGVTVARALEFSQPTADIGAQLVKHVASSTNERAGDGTTTATVLARAMFERGCEAVAAGMNPMDILRGMNDAVAQVMTFIEKNRKNVKSKDDIYNVAMISANGDAVVGQLLADAMDRVGRDGTVTIAEGKTMEHELEVVEGLKFDRGFISPYFVTNAKMQTAEFDDALILVTDDKISSVKSILPILETSAQSNRALVIIAEDIESEVLATLVLNKLKIGLKICAVKAPSFGENRKQQLRDIAVLAGTHVISHEAGDRLEEISVDVLGSAKSVVVGKESTLLLEGGGDHQAISDRCSAIREEMKSANTTAYQKEKLQERLSKLSGGVAILKIGGVSEIAVNEAKDRVEDALNATRAAVEEGVVPGGGTALLYASETIDVENSPNSAQRMGRMIVKMACKVPCRVIADNAGFEGAVVVGNLLREGKMGYGFNAQTGEYVDMFKAGILDPTKVVTIALSDASSVASLMATTEAVVVDAPSKGDNHLVGAGMSSLEGYGM